ncbi:MAG TPA: DEAD/DEAH box helicase [Planctomycetota bacterium]|nr:DEAD/DEAH box helicase [Planctomycetota bacterium]
MLPSVVSSQVRETILDYLGTTFGLAEARGDSALHDLLAFLDGQDGMFRGPYLDLRLPFRRADEGARPPLEIAPRFRPYRHQFRAFERLYAGRGHQPQHTLITTGTGSGKTECFLFPILDDCFRRQGEPGIKAIVLYPMNALATDQARRLAAEIHRDPRLRGVVSAGLYVGGEGSHGAMGPDAVIDQRAVLRQSPPDILLTNYKMLDFLLLRPDDAQLWRRNEPGTLRYLVLDELHTYDGAQGADVACLIRRLKSRLECGPGSVCCVGTSATIASPGGGAAGGDGADGAGSLTRFAGELFEEYFASDSVITEDRLDADEALGAAADLELVPSPEQAAELAPRAFDEPGRWLRRQAELWLGEGLPAESPAFELELGRRLARHAVLRQILRTVARGPRPVDEVDRDLERWFEGWEALPRESRGRALDSFLALVSAARREVEAAAGAVAGAGRFGGPADREVGRFEETSGSGVEGGVASEGVVASGASGGEVEGGGGSEEVEGSDASEGVVASGGSGGGVEGGVALEGVVATPTLPFLTVQLHLWLRELRRLVRTLPLPSGAGPAPRFRWISDGEDPATAAERWFQIVHCRECGAQGVGALAPEGHQRLDPDPEKMARAWLDRHRSCRGLFLAPGAASGEGGAAGGREGLERAGVRRGGIGRQFLCTACLCLRALASCSCDAGGRAPGPAHAPAHAPADGPAGGDETGVPDAQEGGARRPAFVEVLVSEELTGGTPPRFRQQCPLCGSDDALSILGSRAASLLSVGVSQLFSSELNDDRKLLAFTDSVQDASHRAAFFGARTYTFNLRTAIQGALEGCEEDPPLDELAPRILAHWRDRMPEDRLLAALLPPDLRELPAYRDFLDSPERPPAEYVESLLQRLGWEVVSEYGLNSRVGRTLELSGCSTVSPERGALAAAAADLALMAEEGDLTAQQPLRAPTPADWEHFLAAVLRRARIRGGLDHPLLHGFFRGGGNWYLLTRGRNPLIAPFHKESVLPRLLVDRDHPVFDPVVSPASSLTWARDWAERCLGVDRRDPGIDELYRRALDRLTHHGLLVRHSLGRGAFGWALSRRSHLARRRAGAVVCDVCRREVAAGAGEAGAWAGRRCPHYRCGGTLRPVGDREPSYYARIYRSGRLSRIYCQEHTGLLQREEREELERRFKDGDAPDAPNLIVCTPTLEMGIDIGDLSATVLCSVPPTPANYLQRLGRAGRRTGNAVSVTMAVQRPHDLYFYAQPLEMLAGQVLPPGAFLDAPEMLKRQLVAFGMDRWARGVDVPLPRKTRFVLGAQGETVFPGPFLRFWREQRSVLVEELLQRFAAVLSPENADRLREFARGDAVEDLIRTAFDAVGAERGELQRLIKRTRARLAAIEAEPELTEEAEVERHDLRSTLRVLARLLDELGNKYPLNVLTDAGVLPNYAFPEHGVTLQAVLSEKDGKGGSRYETVEYVRPASSAIRELAPFNTFYAEGRSVRVDEIDIGSQAQPLLEHWRLCASCNHAERELDAGGSGASAAGGGADTGGAAAEVADRCPRCGHPGWPDAGQRRVMVPFRRARALTTRLEAASRGVKEQRDQARYRLLDLIDVAQENWGGARVIASLPFGYELLKDLDLREVNFGEQSHLNVKSLEVAGQTLAEDGFEVCLDCGRVQERASSKRAFRHAAYCRARKESSPERTRRVFLYRALRSEALRILLPVADMSLERKLASFKAALELGFRRHFRGRPDHLQIKVTDEPTPSGSGRRRFLLVYDSVPGGTGYLSQLWQEDVFFDVLQGALRALESCVCQRTDAEGAAGAVRDGCYRCLYAFQVQRELPHISSREAQRMLREVLGKRAELEDVMTLSEVSIEALVESELELYFLESLEGWAQRTPGARWEQGIAGGKPRWTLTLPGEEARAWDIVGQVDLGSKQGVLEPSRPDFLIRPRSGDPGIRPVAVFCDGFAYHALPGEEQGRIGDDVRKRQSILDAEAAVVWSVTWDDLEELAKGARAPAGSIGFGIATKTLKAVGAKTGMEWDPGRLRENAVTLLLEYLARPDLEWWRRLSTTAATAWLLTGPFVDDETGERVDVGLEGETGRFRVGPAPVSPAPLEGCERLGRVQEDGELTRLARVRREEAAAGAFDELRMVLRLFDHAEARSDGDFRRSWRAWLSDWNLLQFHPDLRVLSSEAMAGGWGAPAGEEPREARPAAEAAEQADRAADEAARLRELLELATAEARPLIAAVAAADLPLPEVGFELQVGSASRARPEAELAWPEASVAVLAGGQVADRQAFERDGWLVLELPLEVEVLVEALGERLAAMS